VCLIVRVSLVVSRLLLVITRSIVMLCSIVVFGTIGSLQVAADYFRVAIWRVDTFRAIVSCSILIFMAVSAIGLV
jgi:hypothetical protein